MKPHFSGVDPNARTMGCLIPQESSLTVSRHLGTAGGVNPDVRVIIRTGEEEAEVCDAGKGRRGKPGTICVLRNGGSGSELSSSLQPERRYNAANAAQTKKKKKSFTWLHFYGSQFNLSIKLPIKKIQTSETDIFHVSMFICSFNFNASSSDFFYIYTAEIKF